MKLVISFFCFITLGFSNSFACSMSIDDNYLKNQLMAHGVSFNELALPSVTGLAINSYTRSFEGDDGGGKCPDYIITSGRISMNHAPSLSKNCSYAVTVTVRGYMGSDIPEGPIEDVSFSSPEAACSTSLSSPRVFLRLPVKPKKPILVRRFP